MIVRIKAPPSIRAEVLEVLGRLAASNRELASVLVGHVDEDDPTARWDAVRGIDPVERWRRDKEAKARREPA